jgi:exopolysaccharide biosynthesis protein
VSRGTTLAETAALLKEFGSFDGINLDGGGSTTMVVKDAVTGVHAIVNKPSEFFSLQPPVDSVQRPVLDVLGVQIDDE